MTVEGGCLCGGVRFAIERAVGPFELCHCTRCRKASGSAFVAGLGVDVRDYRLLSGADLIGRFEAPVRERPPGFRTAFCTRCGSPVPDPSDDATWFEIPAGSLDGDVGARPDRHIFVEHRAPWFEITDGLPQLTKRDVIALRRSEVSVRREEPRILLAARQRTTRQRISQEIGRLLDPVWAYIRQHPGLRTDGHNVAVYWGDAGIEVGVEVVRTIDATDEVVASATPAGTVATAAHFGPYAELGRTHEAVCAWCAKHGRALAGPFWEVYGDWNDDPSMLRTDVFYLLR